MCEHIIGMLYAYEDTGLVTLDSLTEHIEEQQRAYDRGWTWGKPYGLSDYCDKRKSTDLTRFEYCPRCGKKIDWKGIKKGWKP